MAKGRDYLKGILDPSWRFWTGVCLIPLYFFIQTLWAKGLALLLLGFIVRLGGKRIRLGSCFLLTLSITFFHLLSPSGRILWELAGWSLTSGALERGLLKSLTLCGLIFISLFSVTPELNLPGRLGGLLGWSFYYFEILLEGRKKISPRRFMASLDEALLELFPPEDFKGPPRFPPQQAGSHKKGWALFYSLTLGGFLWILGLV